MSVFCGPCESQDFALTGLRVIYSAYTLSVVLKSSVLHCVTQEIHDRGRKRESARRKEKKAEVSKK